MGSRSEHVDRALQPRCAGWRAYSPGMPRSSRSMVGFPSVVPLSNLVRLNRAKAPLLRRTSRPFAPGGARLGWGARGLSQGPVFLIAPRRLGRSAVTVSSVGMMDIVAILFTDLVG